MTELKEMKISGLLQHEEIGGELPDWFIDDFTAAFPDASLEKFGGLLFIAFGDARPFMLFNTVTESSREGDTCGEAIMFHLQSPGGMKLTHLINHGLVSEDSFADEDIMNASYAIRSVGDVAFVLLRFMPKELFIHKVFRYLSGEDKNGVQTTDTEEALMSQLNVSGRLPYVHLEEDYPQLLKALMDLRDAVLKADEEI